MANFDVRVELLAGRWVDITGDVYTRDRIEIERGRPDETSDVDPAKCKLTINNRGGKYSPRNPNGPYYGRIGRNTPLRVTIGIPTVGDANVVDENDVTTHTAPSVDSRASSGLLICAWATSFEPGEYTLPASMTRDAETSAEGSTVASAYEELTEPGDTGQRTADFTPDEGGSTGYAAASVAMPGDNGAPVIEEFWDAVRYAEDVAFLTGEDTQAGWWLVAVQAWQYDYNRSMPNTPQGTSGQWTLIADSQTANNSVARVKVWTRRVLVDGSQQVTFPTAGDGNRNNHARLYLLSDVQFSAARFAGEVSAWPPRWHHSEGDVWVPIEAGGILRRLGQGSAPIRSAIYREEMSPGKTTPVAYWPCEDRENAGSIASALDNGDPMLIVGEPKLAEFDDFAASASLPTMQAGMFSGQVPNYDVGDESQVRWLLAVPEDGIDDDQVLLTVWTNGSARQWEIVYKVDNAMRFRIYDIRGQQIQEDSVTWSEDVDGALLRMSLEVTETDNGDIDYNLGLLPVGAREGRFVSHSVSGETFGRIERVQVNVGSEDSDLGDTAIGHVSVHNTITTIFDLWAALDAWRDESAGRRIERLCAEEEIPFTVALPTADLDDTALMGPQGAETLLDLLREAAQVDGGILHETREEVGLSYRPRTSLYNQQEQ